MRKEEIELKVADEKHAKDKDGEGKKKEQSVLQAKLTKLALQIGYGGKYLVLFKLSFFSCLSKNRTF